MRTFIYLSRYNRRVFKGLIKGGMVQNLTTLREYVCESLNNWK